MNYCLNMGLKIMKKNFIRLRACWESPKINYLFCQWCSYCSCQLLWQFKEPHIIFVALQVTVNYWLELIEWLVTTSTNERPVFRHDHWLLTNHRPSRVVYPYPSIDDDGDKIGSIGDKITTFVQFKLERNGMWSIRVIDNWFRV